MAFQWRFSSDSNPPQNPTIDVHPLYYGTSAEEFAEVPAGEVLHIHAREVLRWYDNATFHELSYFFVANEGVAVATKWKNGSTGEIFSIWNDQMMPLNIALDMGSRLKETPTGFQSSAASAETPDP